MPTGDRLVSACYHAETDTPRPLGFKAPLRHNIPYQRVLYPPFLCPSAGAPDE
jgi:hypothetical protein